MTEYIVPIIISFVVLVIIGIVIQKFALSMIDTEYCRRNYLSMANSVIEEKIKKIEERAFKVSWKIGGIIGCGISVLFFILKIFKFNHFFFGILKFLAPVIVCIIIALIIAQIIVDAYCTKHFGKSLAFIDMSNNASEIKKAVCKEDVSPIDEGSEKYGDKYLLSLGKGLGSSIKRTIWFYRIIGAVIGFAAGSVTLFILMTLNIMQENVFFVILAGAVGEAIFTILFNIFAKKYCVEHYGYLATYYQLHVDIYSIKKNQDKILAKDGQAKKIDSISLKEGYQFASVPSRIFAEKTDAPGNYYCPYCYAEIYSETSSMCGSCGKSLGESIPSNPQPEKIDLTKSPSPVAEQASSPDVQANAVKVEATVEPKAAPVSESAGGNQAASKIKKLYIIIGAVMLAVIAGLVSVIIYLLNKGPEYVYQYLPSETQYEKVEVPVYNYEQAEQVDVAMDLTLRCTENLRIRASDDFESDVIITMNSGTKVKVLTIGKQDEVDGVKSNWIQVEVLPGGKDKDLNRIPNGTTGWCFGGFLESCTKN